jgi:hypothetical protein
MLFLDFVAVDRRQGRSEEAFLQPEQRKGEAGEISDLPFRRTPCRQPGDGDALVDTIGSGEDIEEILIEKR